MYLLNYTYKLTEMIKHDFLKKNSSLNYKLFNKCHNMHLYFFSCFNLKIIASNTYYILKMCVFAFIMLPHCYGNTRFNILVSTPSFYPFCMCIYYLI